ncbi:Emopamil-binding protein [Dothidotthia symphoricarpi CBS 119687]|uniref:Emopamil-binding protein n=1 Tax=Dothidotthia symphoricarpi CBS 119687 TaxID=1392245 RepID=A0A6A5ZXY7_9PLEO|nr:Emopamil-binding protein [Dothidotthia symphoricarpi CBS 119687]KAF2124632.1 Emopamil-binding protein [Dothidotthia symphoricarpi CBS 119687]
MSFNSTIPGALHPYYPVGVEITGYLMNFWNTVELLSMFTAGITVIFSATYVITKRLRPTVSTGDLSTIMWFVLCGFIHSFFEGYFSYNFRRMGGMQDLFGQLWKEYALSDSRYLTQDAFVLCMESVTAFFWGPLSFVTAGLIATDHPLRYSLQLIVSLGQFYGDVLYYATSLFDHYILDVSYSRPEQCYYWGYFVLMNAFWIVIPGYLMWQSVDATTQAFAAVNEAASLMKRAEKMGYTKKKA